MFVEIQILAVVGEALELGDEPARESLAPVVRMHEQDRDERAPEEGPIENPIGPDHAIFACDPALTVMDPPFVDDIPLVERSDRRKIVEDGWSDEHRR